MPRRCSRVKRFANRMTHVLPFSGRRRQPYQTVCGCGVCGEDAVSTSMGLARFSTLRGEACDYPEGDCEGSIPLTGPQKPGPPFCD